MLISPFTFSLMSENLKEVLNLGWYHGTYRALEWWLPLAPLPLTIPLLSVIAFPDWLCLRAYSDITHNITPDRASIIHHRFPSPSDDLHGRVNILFYSHKGNINDYKTTHYTLTTWDGSMHNGYFLNYWCDPCTGMLYVMPTNQNKPCINWLNEIGWLGCDALGLGEGLDIELFPYWNSDLGNYKYSYEEVCVWHWLQSQHWCLPLSSFTDFGLTAFLGSYHIRSEH